MVMMMVRMRVMMPNSTESNLVASLSHAAQSCLAHKLMWVHRQTNAAWRSVQQVSVAHNTLKQETRVCTVSLASQYAQVPGYCKTLLGETLPATRTKQQARKILPGSRIVSRSKGCREGDIPYLGRGGAEGGCNGSPTDPHALSRKSRPAPADPPGGHPSPLGRPLGE